MVKKIRKGLALSDYEHKRIRVEGACPERAKRVEGFTLLELLIVVGLIGILIAVSVTAYSTIQKKTRDARRANDMKAIQNAFEQYYADNNSTYPAAESVITTYLPGGIPLDPKSAEPYTVTTDVDGYCVCATLEGTTTGGNASVAGNCTFEAGPSFCVKNLQ